jgi:hypothetical protein
MASVNNVGNISSIVQHAPVKLLRGHTIAAPPIAACTILNDLDSDPHPLYAV